ncbi:ABC transporter permease [Allonocardiopsis opalescens]|uniref:Transport permease protein n=1 Tax=Allonocardiopsis opalescens TaxID=1144618 RepID=A0A2T0Q5E0_9ACTN|nr:ABC transporter permease [Allonocardiopsis opalescens]PRX99045.1 ABC-2 type transport system permease protein [Allonocardiopsis opalescens]
MTMLLKLTAVESRLMLRDVAWLFTLGVPLFVMLGFGLPFALSPGGPPPEAVSGIESLVVTAVTIALGLVGLYMVPTALAAYREKAILRRLSTTPARPAALLAVQLLLQLVLAVVSLVLLVGTAALLLGTGLPERPAALLGVHLLGAAGTFAIGLLIAAVAPTAQAANGIGVLLYFPLAFLSGLMLPREQMPAALAAVGEFTPLGAFRSAAEAAWTGADQQVLPLVIMAGYAVAVGAAAVRFFRWE